MGWGVLISSKHSRSQQRLAHSRSSRCLPKEHSDHEWADRWGKRDMRNACECVSVCEHVCTQVCVHVCALMCVCVCTRVSMCTHVPVSVLEHLTVRSALSRVSLIHCPPCFLGQGLLPSQLVWPPANPETLSPPSPRNGLSAGMQLYLFTCGLGTQTQVFMLIHQALYQLSQTFQPVLQK